jgi:hypothetical protein
MPKSPPVAVGPIQGTEIVTSRTRFAVAVLIVSVALGNLAFFFSQGLTDIYGDAIAHMEGARRIFDSLTPGYSEVGSVWLPLFHLLAAPLALNDYLWRSGLAGSLVSTAAFAGTAWFLFSLAAELNQNLAAGLLALAGVFVCPNYLYLASTPLTEPLALFWAVLVVYQLFRYHVAGRWRDLLVAAVAACLGTLTRYDEWYVLPFAALFVMLVRNESWEIRIRRTVIFSLVAGAGPLLWFLHNAYRFGNPLEFYNGPFSAKAIYAHQLATTAFAYPTDGKLLLSARYFLEDLKLVFGSWSLELAVLGLIACAASFRDLRRRSAIFLFLVPLPFYINAMAYAAIPLYVPTLFPHTYYNLRYGLEMIPAVALLPSLVISWRLPNKVRYGLLAVFLVVLGAQGVSQLSRGPRELVVVKEGILNNPCRSKLEEAIIRYLRGRYDGQRVLVAVGKWPCVMPKVGIDYRQTISETNEKYWVKMRTEPQNWVEWIIRGQGDAVDELMHAYPQTFRDFTVVEKVSFSGEGSAEVYRRRPGRIVE